MNKQPIEKVAPGDGTRLELHSLFYTVQGEGPLSGVPAVFVRLAGCNLQCPGCDTEYTANRRVVAIEEICDLVEDQFEYTANPRPLVVITGGEPFRQNIAPFVAMLREKQYRVQIETNGTLPVSNHKSLMWHDPGVTIICSPKTGQIQVSIQQLAFGYKYVLHHESIDELTGLPLTALGHKAYPHLALPPVGKPVYIQPMDCKNSHDNTLNMKEALRTAMRNGFVLQAQMHKIWGIE